MTKRAELLTLYASVLPRHLTRAEKEIYEDHDAFRDAMTDAWSEAAEALDHFNRMTKASGR